MMVDVTLLYDPDCPNVSDAREQLLKAFVNVELAPKWQEVNRTAKDTPPDLRRFGSPTILVNGHDVAGEQPKSQSNSCRIYRSSTGGFTGVPSVEQISDALRKGSTTQGFPADARIAHVGGGWKGSLSVLPAIGVALLPSITCPACWPAYAALLSSVGIGFLPSNTYLFPLTGAAVLFALAILAWQARTRHRFGPLVLATAGAAVLLVGGFGFQSDLVLYTGLGILIAGSLWNAWPARLNLTSSESVAAGACPTCKSSDSEARG